MLIKRCEEIKLYAKMKQNKKYMAKEGLMKNYIYLILAVFIVSGCAAMDDIKDNYLGGTKDAVPLKEANTTFKENYLGSVPLVFDAETTRRLTYMAQEKILSIPKYKEDFDLLSAAIDQELMMPDASSYAFIHFKPKEEKMAEYQKKTYMVVISLFGERIVYADLFQAPLGDPLYRYKDIIENIRKD